MTLRPLGRRDGRTTLLPALLLAAGAALAGAGAASAAPPPLAVGAARTLVAARPGAFHGHVDVAWDGRVFLVVWEESSATTARIYAARVSRGGQVLDPAGILLGSGEDDHVRPTVAGAPGTFLVAWERQIEGTYSDLEAAMVSSTGRVTKSWDLSLGDNGQSRPAAAWNGQVFLVVWQDEPDADNEEVFGTRVTASGLTLDGCSDDSCPGVDDTGIPIGQAPGDQVDPVVAGGPDMFVVPWADRGAPTPGDVRASGVALQGSTYYPPDFPVSTAAGDQSQPAVARNGTSYLVAWTDARTGGPDIRATRLDLVDQWDVPPAPLDPDGRPVSVAAGPQSEPSVSSRGGGWVVAWTDARSGGSDVYASRVGAGGRVLDPAGVPVAATGAAESGPELAAAGAGLQIVAYERDGRTAFRLLG